MFFLLVLFKHPLAGTDAWSLQTVHATPDLRGLRPWEAPCKPGKEDELN